MGIKQLKPITPSMRFQQYNTFEEITTDEPYKPLLRPLKKTGGRNNLGRITAYHRGGGHKRLYRIIDFKRDKRNIPGVIVSIEYDPNRSAFISLVKYKDGEYRYIIAPKGIKVGDEIIAGEKVDIKIGNALPLKDIPDGTIIHNVELKVGKGGQLARSAGSYAQILGKEGKYAILKLPSGEMRKVLLECYATIGQVSNEIHENISLGKAGRKRWLGRRPIVRGVAMNPIDHPHGGGEGRSSVGRHPVTPWGKPTKGAKTRKSKPSDKYIIKRRK